MRVQGSGSAIFLMLLVLGVMAIVGVFGLPQFEPVVASPNTMDDDRWSESIASYEQAGAGESVAQGVEDLFAPAEEKKLFLFASSTNIILFSFSSKFWYKSSMISQFLFEMQ